MKLVSVVCRIVDEQTQDPNGRLANIEPAQFLDLLSESSQVDQEELDLAALEAELNASKAPAKPVAAVAAVVAPGPTVSAGMIVLPRAAAEPIVMAKTRGEVYEKLDELLSQFGARLAKEGE